MSPYYGAERDYPPPAQTEYPIRQQSAYGEPKPNTSIERTCRRCGASFIGLAPGKTGERGIWLSEYAWFCSQECHDTPDDRALR